MRGIILIESLVLVCIALNYILKCLEYKHLRELFYNRGKSIKMLNEEVYIQKIRYAGTRDTAALYEDLYNYHKRLYYEAGEEIKRLKHRVYVLRKDIKRKDKAIVRYKAQNELFRNRYHESESRCEELRDEVLAKQATLDLAKRMYWSKREERDAYLYCLRQIQEEVTNAKEE